MIGEAAIEVPENIEFDLRFERTPHDTLVLLIKAEWPEAHLSATSITSARALVIRAQKPDDAN
ncbi:MAG TPA: hypothetical protein VIG64_00800 [Actinomycetota bacterium]